MRAFIAVDIRPDEKILRVIRKMSSQRVRVKAVEEENIHLTLKFLGEIGDAQASEIMGAMESLGSYPAFSIYLRGVGAFPSESRPRTVWIGLEYPETLEKIWRDVEDISERIGVQRERRGFSPHITIGRVKDTKNARRLRDFLKEHEMDDFGERKVEEIKLKKSVLTQSGPIYSDIFKVRLRSDRD